MFYSPHSSSDILGGYFSFYFVLGMGDKMRRMRTKKEIQHRMMDIFRKSNPDSVALNDVEVARVHELEWVLGVGNDKK